MAVTWVASCGHILTLAQVKDWTGVCPHCKAGGETMVVVEQPKAGSDLYFWGDEMRETEMQREYHDALVEMAKLEAENAQLRATRRRADEPVTFEREYHDALVEVAKLEAENAKLLKKNQHLEWLQGHQQTEIKRLRGIIGPGLEPYATWYWKMERAAVEEAANEERPARTPQDIVADHVDHVVEHLKVGRTTKDQEAQLTRALGDRKVGRALGR